MNKLKKCLICSKIFDRPLRSKKSKYKWKISWNEYKKRKFCSNKCRSFYHSQRNRGVNNANWKGGKTKCIDCGKELSQRYSFRNTTRCRKCWFKYAKGKNHPLWKGGFPKCAICGKQTGDTYSKLCHKCRRGKNHHCWKGGISTLQARIKTISKYRQWRKAIFQRDNYTCQKCGIAGVKICPHHIKQFALILKENNIQTIQQAINCKELWDLDKGITLCYKCHKLTDSFAKNLS